MNYKAADKWAQKAFTDPYYEGVKAFDEGCNREANPHPIETDPWKSWNDGFRNAGYDAADADPWPVLERPMF